VLAAFVFGTPINNGLIWLIKKCRGKSPSKVEKISEDAVQTTIDGITIDIPLQLMRLYQDLSVRTAAQKLMEPLQRDGIDSFEVRENRTTVVRVEKSEVSFFTKPNIPDEILIDEVRRSAYSIISLAFKEDNKWRLHDGTNGISVDMEDGDFLSQVENNQISFSKGDILICDVRVTQKRTDKGLRTEYIVEKVIDHRSAARQLPLQFPESDGKR
jgi:hypothetical protein